MASSALEEIENISQYKIIGWYIANSVSLHISSQIRDALSDGTLTRQPLTQKPEPLAAVMQVPSVSVLPHCCDH